MTQIVVAVVAVGAWLCACQPVTAPSVGDDPGPDFSVSVQDLAAADSNAGCEEVAGNLLMNPSFEAGPGVARNTGNPPSTIPGGWDGCCDPGGGTVTTVWTVDLGGRCGARALRIDSSSASENVLSQVRTVAGASGRLFTVSGWVKVTGGGVGTLRLDVFDLGAKKVIAETDAVSPPASQQYQRLSRTGTLPAVGNPMIQVRLRTSGAINALADDIAFTLN